MRGRKKEEEKKSATDFLVKVFSCSNSCAYVTELNKREEGEKR